MIHININGNIHFDVDELISLTVTMDADTKSIDRHVEDNNLEWTVEFETPNEECLSDHVCGEEECYKSCRMCEYHDLCLQERELDQAEEESIDMEAIGRKFNAEFGKCSDCMCDNECIECPLTNAQRMDSVCPAEEGLVYVKSPDDLDCLHADGDDCSIDTVKKKMVNEVEQLTKTRCVDCPCQKPTCSRECMDDAETGCCTNENFIDNPVVLGCAGWVKEDCAFNEDYFREFIRCSSCPNHPECDAGTDYNDYVEVTDYLRSKGKNIAACLEDGDIDICDDAYDDITTLRLRSSDGITYVHESNDITTGEKLDAYMKGRELGAEFAKRLLNGLKWWLR